MEILQAGNIISTVLLLVLLPAVAYIYKSTPSRDEFMLHIEDESRRVDRIEATLTRVEDKIDDTLKLLLEFRNSQR